MIQRIKKPEGWDDIPKEIVDSAASKPEDWDEDLDGEWEAPKISNPDYKGPWSPKKLTILPIKDHGYTLKLITRIIKTILNFMLLILLSISALMYGKLNLEPSLAISF